MNGELIGTHGRTIEWAHPQLPPAQTEWSQIGDHRCKSCAIVGIVVMTLVNVSIISARFRLSFMVHSFNLFSLSPYASLVKFKKNFGWNYTGLSPVIVCPFKIKTGLQQLHSKCAWTRIRSHRQDLTDFAVGFATVLLHWRPLHQDLFQLLSSQYLNC